MARSVIDILEELESAHGSNARIDILEVSRNNDLLKRAFVAAQDPDVVYYVSKFRMPKSNPTNGDAWDDDEMLEHFLSKVLPRLSTREVTGNAAKDLVVSVFEEMDLRQQKWCKRILIHNLRCGVQPTTINKVWPKLITSFSVALAGTLKSQFTRGKGIEILEPVSYPVRVEPKLDGLRCIAIKDGGKVTLYTRNGTVLETLPRIRAALEAGAYGNSHPSHDCGVVLDGEMMGLDWNESTSVMMSSKHKKDDSNIVFNVFDALPLRDWHAQSTELTYRVRTEFVASIVQAIGTDCVRQVPYVMVNDEPELIAFFAKCMDEGHEGVMLKDLDSSYEWDRSRNILKLKPCVTYEGVVTSWYEGRVGTKHEGMFGGFRVVLPNGVTTRVGGGYNDKVRAQIQLETPDAWVGRIAECEAQPDPFTEDGLSADGKMRFPVYVRTRDEADVSPEVMEAYRTWVARNSTRGETT